MKAYLLNSLPSSVRFAPLYHVAESIGTSLDFVLSDYCQLTGSTTEKPRAFDVVILGMGSDGHTASFFPDAENIKDLLDLNSAEPLLTCYSPSTEVQRVTWSLPMLLNTDFLALHFTGAVKQTVFERAVGGGDVTELPIRGAIFQDHVELNVYYAD